MHIVISNYYPAHCSPLYCNRRPTPSSTSLTRNLGSGIAKTLIMFRSFFTDIRIDHYFIEQPFQKVMSPIFDKIQKSPVTTTSKLSQPFFIVTFTRHQPCSTWPELELTLSIWL